MVSEMVSETLETGRQALLRQAGTPQKASW
jgi:hypothetical protein